MTLPANYNKKNTNNNSSNKNNDSNSTSNNNIKNTNSNNSSNRTTDKNNNNKRNNITNYNTKDAHDNDNDDGNITIKRSTFTKLAIIGVAALMVSSFFAGYTLHQGIAPTTPTYVTLPTTSTITPSTNPTANTTTMPPTTAPPSAPPPAPTTISSVSLDDDPVRGNKDASITLVEFSDYQCPFCKRTFDETIPEIKQKYIDTGKVKHVFRDYPIPFNHQNAIPAAIAAECADEQGKFWEYHDILFTKQTEWENLSGNATSDKFKEYAASNITQIDTNKFNSCIDSQKYKDEVDKDIADGSTYGVSGTPTFYIGNDEKGYTQIVGAQPVASFESEINKIEAEASSNSTTATANNNTTEV